MKTVLGLALVCTLLISCNSTKSEYEIECAILEQQRDSLLNTDVQLSFMGIELGKEVWRIDSAASQNKIMIDSCSNGIYVGKVIIPYLHSCFGCKDTVPRTMEALMRIGSLNERVASIELFTKNEDAFDFFRDTYCERYYNQYNEKLNKSLPGLNSDNYYDDYHWQFKNQSLRLYKMTHKEIGEGRIGYNNKLHKYEYGLKELKMFDGTAIEYIYDSLYNSLLENAINEKKKNDSIKNAAKKAEDLQRHIENKKLNEEFKNNI